MARISVAPSVVEQARKDMDAGTPLRKVVETYGAQNFQVLKEAGDEEALKTKGIVPGPQGLRWEEVEQILHRAQPAAPSAPQETAPPATPMREGFAFRPYKAGRLYEFPSDIPSRLAFQAAAIGQGAREAWRQHSTIKGEAYEGLLRAQGNAEKADQHQRVREGKEPSPAIDLGYLADRAAENGQTIVQVFQGMIMFPIDVTMYATSLGGVGYQSNAAAVERRHAQQMAQIQVAKGRGWSHVPLERTLLVPRPRNPQEWDALLDSIKGAPEFDPKAPGAQPGPADLSMEQKAVLLARLNMARYLKADPSAALPQPGAPVLRALGGKAPDSEGDLQLDSEPNAPVLRIPLNEWRSVRTQAEIDGLRAALDDEKERAKGNPWTGIHALPVAMGLDMARIFMGGPEEWAKNPVEFGVTLRGAAGAAGAVLRGPKAAITAGARVREAVNWDVPFDAATRAAFGEYARESGAMRPIVADTAARAATVAITPPGASAETQAVVAAATDPGHKRAFAARVRGPVLAAVEVMDRLGGKAHDIVTAEPIVFRVGKAVHVALEAFRRSRLRAAAQDYTTSLVKAGRASEVPEQARALGERNLAGDAARGILKGQVPDDVALGSAMQFILERRKGDPEAAKVAGKIDAIERRYGRAGVVPDIGKSFADTIAELYPEIGFKVEELRARVARQFADLTEASRFKDPMVRAYLEEVRRKGRLVDARAFLEDMPDQQATFYAQKQFRQWNQDAIALAEAEGGAKGEGGIELAPGVSEKQYVIDRLNAENEYGASVLMRAATFGTWMEDYYGVQAEVPASIILSWIHTARPDAWANAWKLIQRAETTTKLSELSLWKRVRAAATEQGFPEFKDIPVKEIPTAMKKAAPDLFAELAREAGLRPEEALAEGTAPALARALGDRLQKRLGSKKAVADHFDAVQAHVADKSKPLPRGQDLALAPKIRTLKVLAERMRAEGEKAVVLSASSVIAKTPGVAQAMQALGMDPARPFKPGDLVSAVNSLVDAVKTKAGPAAADGLRAWIEKTKAGATLVGIRPALSKNQMLVATTLRKVHGDFARASLALSRQIKGKVADLYTGPNAAELGVLMKEAGITARVVWAGDIEALLAAVERIERRGVTKDEIAATVALVRSWDKAAQAYQDAAKPNFTPEQLLSAMAARQMPKGWLENPAVAHGAVEASARVARELQAFLGETRLADRMAMAIEDASKPVPLLLAQADTMPMETLKAVALRYGIDSQGLGDAALREQVAAQLQADKQVPLLVADDLLGRFSAEPGVAEFKTKLAEAWEDVRTYGPAATPENYQMVRTALAKALDDQGKSEAVRRRLLAESGIKVEIGDKPAWTNEQLLDAYINWWTGKTAGMVWVDARTIGKLMHAPDYAEIGNPFMGFLRREIQREIERRNLSGEAAIPGHTIAGTMEFRAGLRPGASEAVKTWEKGEPGKKDSPLGVAAYVTADQYPLLLKPEQAAEALTNGVVFGNAGEAVVATRMLLDTMQRLIELTGQPHIGPWHWNKFRNYFPTFHAKWTKAGKKGEPPEEGFHEPRPPIPLRTFAPSGRKWREGREGAGTQGGAWARRTLPLTKRVHEEPIRDPNYSFALGMSEMLHDLSYFEFVEFLRREYGDGNAKGNPIQVSKSNPNMPGWEQLTDKTAEAIYREKGERSGPPADLQRQIDEFVRERGWDRKNPADRENIRTYERLMKGSFAETPLYGSLAGHWLSPELSALVIDGRGWVENSKRDTYEAAKQSSGWAGRWYSWADWKADALALRPAKFGKTLLSFFGYYIRNKATNEAMAYLAGMWDANRIVAGAPGLIHERLSQVVGKSSPRDWYSTPRQILAELHSKDPEIRSRVERDIYEFGFSDTFFATGEGAIGEAAVPATITTTSSPIGAAMSFGEALEAAREPKFIPSERLPQIDIPPELQSAYQKGLSRLEADMAAANAPPGLWEKTKAKMQSTRDFIVKRAAQEEVLYKLWRARQIRDAAMAGKPELERVLLRTGYSPTEIATMARPLFDGEGKPRPDAVSALGRIEANKWFYDYSRVGSFVKLGRSGLVGFTVGNAFWTWAWKTIPRAFEVLARNPVKAWLFNVYATQRMAMDTLYEQSEDPERIRALTASMPPALRNRAMLLPGLVTETVSVNPKAPPGARQLLPEVMARYLDLAGSTLGDPFQAGPGWPAVDMLGSAADPAARVEAAARKIPSSISIGSGFGLQLAMLAAGIDPQTRERLRDDSAANRALRMAGIVSPGWTPFVGYYYQALERADEKAPDPRGFFRDTVDALLRYGLSIRVAKLSREQAERTIRTTTAWAARIHSENTVAHARKLLEAGRSTDEFMQQARAASQALAAAMQLKLRQLGSDPITNRERDAILDAHWLNLTPQGTGVQLPAEGR